MEQIKKEMVYKKFLTVVYICILGLIAWLVYYNSMRFIHQVLLIPIQALNTINISWVIFDILISIIAAAILSVLTGISSGFLGLFWFPIDEKSNWVKPFEAAAYFLVGGAMFAALFYGLGLIVELFSAGNTFSRYMSYVPRFVSGLNQMIARSFLANIAFIAVFGWRWYRAIKILKAPIVDV